MAIPNIETSHFPNKEPNIFPTCNTFTNSAWYIISSLNGIKYYYLQGPFFKKLCSAFPKYWNVAISKQRTKNFPKWRGGSREKADNFLKKGPRK